jgi:hypothetical protein
MISCFPYHDEFIAIVDKYPSLSWIADTEEEAIKGLKILIQEVESDLL